MSDVITTTQIDGYYVSIALDAIGLNHYAYATYLHVFNGIYETASICIGYHIFNQKIGKVELIRYAKEDINELKKRLAALAKALPNAESVKNGVHEL